MNLPMKNCDHTHIYFFFPTAFWDCHSRGELQIQGTVWCKPITKTCHSSSAFRTVMITIVGSEVFPKIRDMHGTTTIQEISINHSVMAKWLLQKMVCNAFTQGSIQSRWVLFKTGGGPLAFSSLTYRRCTREIWAETMGVQKCRQAVHVQSEKPCGFRRLRA